MRRQSSSIRVAAVFFVFGISDKVQPSFVQPSSPPLSYRRRTMMCGGARRGAATLSGLFFFSKSQVRVTETLPCGVSVPIKLVGLKFSQPVAVGAPQTIRRDAELDPPEAGATAGWKAKENLELSEKECVGLSMRCAGDGSALPDGGILTSGNYFAIGFEKIRARRSLAPP
jgi:hypothetical protein